MKGTEKAKKNNNDTISPIVLQPTESVLWQDVKKTGFINRKIVQVLAITNFNIILWKEGQPQTTVPISDLSDVIVMDRKSTAHHIIMELS